MGPPQLVVASVQAAESKVVMTRGSTAQSSLETDDWLWTCDHLLSLAGYKRAASKRLLFCRD